MASKKKYVAIIKIGNNSDGSARCVKYRFDKILMFMPFLEKKYPGWRWMNIYVNRGDEKRKYLRSFTKNNKPVSNEI